MPRDDRRELLRVRVAFLGQIERFYLKPTRRPQQPPAAAPRRRAPRRRAPPQAQAAPPPPAAAAARPTESLRGARRKRRPLALRHVKREDALLGDRWSNRPPSQRLLVVSVGAVAPQQRAHGEDGLGLNVKLGREAPREPGAPRCADQPQPSRASTAATTAARRPGTCREPSRSRPLPRCTYRARGTPSRARAACSDRPSERLTDVSRSLERLAARPSIESSVEPRLR